jgi:CheY-like chemotaxis protein
MLSVEEKTGSTKPGNTLASAALASGPLAAGALRRGVAMAPSRPTNVVYARASSGEATVRNARVLVCDDETRLGDLTAGLLQECGFRAGFVPNAVLAMQYLDQHQDTSVLLLDVNLSGSQSTFELLTELAMRPRRPRVVLTSGSAKQDIRAELTHHPLVVGYLEKPYAEEELTSMISDAVS